MKKLFISCPMRGRTKEAIDKTMDRMHRLAEIIFDQELEVIPTYISDRKPDTANRSIWYLGESIKMLSDADYFIGVYTDFFKGCEVERVTARAYGIPSYIMGLEHVAVDALEIEREHYARTGNCDG